MHRELLPGYCTCKYATQESEMNFSQSRDFVATLIISLHSPAGIFVCSVVPKGVWIAIV